MAVSSRASRWRMGRASSAVSAGYTSSPRALKPRTLSRSPRTAMRYLCSDIALTQPFPDGLCVQAGQAAGEDDADGGQLALLGVEVADQGLLAEGGPPSLGEVVGEGIDIGAKRIYPVPVFALCDARGFIRCLYLCWVM